MKRRDFLLAGAAGFAGVLASPVVRASTWPGSQPIRFIVPVPPGGGPDFMARLAAQRVGEKLNAKTVVENRAGGSFAIATTAVLNAAPDGYTFLGSAFNHILLNHAVRGVTFDPQADFEVVARTASAPLVMIVSPQRPERTVAELVHAIREDPASWPIAVPALGAPAHLAALEFMHRTGVKLTVATYRGTAPALTDVIGGHVPLLIDAAFALMPTARDGKVRALAIVSKDRSPIAPDLPTMAEAGIPGFEFQSWYGLWAPKGTPLEIRQRVNEIMREAMTDPEVVARVKGYLLEPVVETIDETRAYIAREVPRLAALLKAFDFKPE